MKQWIKTKILEWLTAPEKKKQEVDVKYHDPMPEQFITIDQLTDTVFNEEVVMFNLGKRADGKWLYFARQKYKNEKRAH
jgi:hypothetical protein